MLAQVMSVKFCLGSGGGPAIVEEARKCLLTALDDVVEVVNNPKTTNQPFLPTLPILHFETKAGIPIVYISVLLVKP